MRAAFAMPGARFVAEAQPLPDMSGEGPAAPRPRGLNKSVNIDFRNPITILLLAWIIFLGALGLRALNVGEYPARHATDDEFGFLWGGLNFWHKGTPESWSSLQGGANLRLGEARFDGNGYMIVSPYLDHPPLFTLLAGGWARMTGPVKIEQQSPEGNLVTVWDVDLSKARLLMLVLFSGTFWFLFSLVRSACGAPAALLTVLFYGFMSHAVAMGRLVLADNLSALLLVANAWAVQRWLAGDMRRGAMMAWTMTLTAAAVLTKIPAWCHVPAMVAMLVVAGRAGGGVERAQDDAARRQAMGAIRYVFYGFALGIILYLGWLAHYGLQEFLAVMGSQTSRFRGFNAFQLMSGVPRLLAERDLNGVVIAGWFCLVAQALRSSAPAFVVIGPVYVLAFTFFAGDVLFGWYTLPVLPWLAAALGVTTLQVWRRPVSAMMLAWLLLLLPHAFQTLYIAHYELEQPLRYVYVLVTGGLIMAMLLPQAKAEKVLRMAMIAIVAVVLMREGYEVSNQRTDRISDQEKYLR